MDVVILIILFKIEWIIFWKKYVNRIISGKISEIKFDNKGLSKIYDIIKKTYGILLFSGKYQ